MAFKLKGGKLPYSEGERRVFRVLPAKGAPLVSTAVVARFYRGGDIPFNGRQIVVALVTRLAAKVEANGEPFRVRKSVRSGPNPMEIWLEQR